jgi:hypothetical protein
MCLASTVHDMNPTIFLISASFVAACQVGDGADSTPPPRDDTSGDRVDWPWDLVNPKSTGELTAAAGRDLGTGCNDWYTDKALFHLYHAVSGTAELIVEAADCDPHERVGSATLVLRDVVFEELVGNGDNSSDIEGGFEDRLGPGFGCGDTWIEASEGNDQNEVELQLLFFSGVGSYPLSNACQTGVEQRIEISYEEDSVVGANQVSMPFLQLSSVTVLDES